jgi:hypothetical protein
MQNGGLGEIGIGIASRRAGLVRGREGFDYDKKDWDWNG